MAEDQITITESNSDLQKAENTSLYLLTKAEIDVSISTARTFPRSLKLFLDKAMSMATMSEDIAAACNYVLPRAGKEIEGKSVRLAEIACAAYGNIRSGARVVATDEKTLTAQGVCHDLETNNSVTVEVTRRITKKNGERFSDDMIVVAGNAACAVAYRNAVFKVIPSALTDVVYEKAKEVAKGTEETLPSRRNKAVNYFKELRVTEKQICDVLGIKRIEDIDLDKLATLRGMVAAIKNNEATVQELFSKESAIPVNRESDRMEALIKEAQTPQELENLKKDVRPEQMDLFAARSKELADGKKKEK